MAKVNLRVDPRGGKSGSYKQKLRSMGKIPAVIYGKDISNKAVEVDIKNLEGILRSGAGKNSIIDLTVQESKPNKLTVMIKDLQRDPIKGELLHVDLQKISLQDKLQTSVPIQIVGEAVGAKKGGTMDLRLRELEIECVPTNLPDTISLDVSSLDIGDSFMVSDIGVQGDYSIINDPSAVVVHIVAPRVVEDEDREETAGEAQPEVDNHGADTEKATEE